MLSLVFHTFIKYEGSSHCRKIYNPQQPFFYIHECCHGNYSLIVRGQSVQVREVRAQPFNVAL